ncbi:MAG: hypothetical protein MRY83_23220 [Flavobacteriales bacterium]|nr:hypothetical protein [Flavobacteriales bacterium]
MTKQEYQSRVDHYKNEQKSLKKKSLNFSILRLIAFVMILCAIYGYTISLYSSGIMVILIILGIVLFFYLMKRHAKVNYSVEINQLLSQCNELEIQIKNGHFEDAAKVMEYNDTRHNYAHDLDIFSHGGLFQYLNRTKTIYGASKLVSHLKTPSLVPEEIKKSQDSVKELMPMLDLRQYFWAIGQYILNKRKLEHTSGAFEAKPFELKIHKAHKILPYAALIFFSLITLALLFDIITINVFGMLLLIPLLIAGTFAKKIMSLSAHVEKQLKVLKDYDLLFAKLEETDFKSELICDIKKGLISQNTSARAAIRELSSIISLLDNRMNVFFWFFANSISLWDIRCLVKFDQWEKKYLQNLQPWLEDLGKFEVLISLSNFAFNHPDFSYPDLIDFNKSTSILTSKDLGHPLVAKSKRVCNDFEISGHQFKIVTGANMAGKSTFLRTVAINMILARMGAPVCAKSMTLVPIELVSSMRTTDSLKSEQSYFHAELIRLKMIVERIQDNQKIFIILDEILKGTNSVDKAQGSAMFMKKLVGLKATGIIATHDLSLCELSKQYPENIQNQCFEVEIEGDNIRFDYKLRNGIAQQMNATYLMKKMNLVD